MMNVKSIGEKQSKAGWGCAGSGTRRASDADAIGIGPVRAVGLFGTLSPGARHSSDASLSIEPKIAPLAWRAPSERSADEAQARQHAAEPRPQAGDRGEEGVLAVGRLAGARDVDANDAPAPVRGAQPGRAAAVAAAQQAVAPAAAVLPAMQRDPDPVAGLVVVRRRIDRVHDLVDDVLRRGLVVGGRVEVVMLAARASAAAAEADEGDALAA